MMLKLRQHIKLIHITTLIVILGIIFLAKALPSENLWLGKNPINDLNTGWTMTTQKMYVESVTLPFHLDVKPNETYVAERVFERDFPENMKLRIRSSMQSIRVVIDEEEIFTSLKPQSLLLTSPDASVWHFVELPVDCRGKTLKLVMSSPVKAFSGVVNAIYYGSGDALLFDLFWQDRIGLLISVLIFLLGTLTFAMSFMLNNQGDKRLLYLGLFAVTTSIWMISEAKLLQFFTGNRFVLGGISYMMVALIPIPFSLYVRDMALTRYKKLISVIASVFFIDFLANILLQITGTLGFFHSLFLTNTLLLITILIILFLLFVETIRHKNNHAKKFLQYLSVLTALIVFEIIQFYNQNFIATSVYSRVGFILFFGFLVGDSIKYFNELKVKENEAKFFQKLAYKDILTGGNNRAAFEKEIHERIHGTDLKDFRLVLMDINDLKAINDLFGHQEGDNAIIKCYQHISDAFRGVGDCYRLGGDEFACIVRCSDTKVYERRVNALLKSLHQSQQKLPYKIEVAMGSDVFYSDQNRDFDKFFHHIDHMMYEDKKRSKAQVLGESYEIYNTVKL